MLHQDTSIFLALELVRVLNSPKRWHPQILCIICELLVCLDGRDYVCILEGGPFRWAYLNTPFKDFPSVSAAQNFKIQNLTPIVEIFGDA